MTKNSHFDQWHPLLLCAHALDSNNLQRKGEGYLHFIIAKNKRIIGDINSKGGARRVRYRVRRKPIPTKAVPGGRRKEMA